LGLKSESVVQGEIIRYIKYVLHGWVIKVIRANERGCPDLIACIGGRCYGVEVKREEFKGDPYKQTSPWQRKQLAGISAAGGVSCTVATLLQFKDIYYGNEQY